MTCENNNHALGLDSPCMGESATIIRLAHVEKNPPYIRSNETLGQAVEGNLTHAFRFCPDCGQVNEIFSGLFG